MGPQNGPNPGNHPWAAALGRIASIPATGRTRALAVRRWGHRPPRCVERNGLPKNPLSVWTSSNGPVVATMYKPFFILNAVI